MMMVEIMSRCCDDVRWGGVDGLAFLSLVSSSEVATSTTKCDFIVLLQVNEISLTVNEFY